VVHYGQSAEEPNHCDAAEQIMFTDTQITADNRFLEFNTGDWFMMLGGFTLIGLLAICLA
jgi:hypothetical protein